MCSSLGGVHSAFEIGSWHELKLTTGNINVLILFLGMHMFKKYVVTVLL